MSRLVPLLIAGFAIAAAAACSTTSEATTTNAPATAMIEMAGAMGDPAATPADAIADATLEGGRFGLLDGAGTGHEDLTGTALLARHGAGTTVTIELDNLLAGNGYVAHVHTGACADGGGPHYRHDPLGSEMPPNEIHLALVANGDGSGSMTVENDRVADIDAASVVIHVAGADKLACADLAPIDS